MPYELALPDRYRRAKWKVKIFDKERLEPPHATILHGPRKWRFDLRSERFMDDEPPPGGVSDGLLEVVLSNLALLRRQWDLMHPSNPVGRVHG